MSATLQQGARISKKIRKFFDSVFAGRYHLSS
jgi:hypothetical protein